MLTLAVTLSAARAAAAAELARRVTRELAALSMTAARFTVSRRESVGGPAGSAVEQLGAEGADEVEFLFTAGSGMPARPLAKSASGGELSRVVLALEVVLAAGLGPAEHGVRRGRRRHRR